ncbi:MAG: cytochrome P450 [Solirubrobacteraceae bacterium]
MPTLAFDPFSLQAHEDPYPMYAKLRALGRPAFDEQLGMWTVATHADVIDVLRDWETFSSAQGEDIDDSASYFPPGNLLEHDPPDHRFLRSVIQGPFSPKAIRARLEPYVQAEADRLVAQMAALERADFAMEFAWSLPTSVVMEFLGLPREDREQLTRWQMQFMERVPGDRRPPSSAMAAAGHLAEYFAAVIDDRRRSPREDLLTFIANGEAGGAPIGDAAVGMAHVIFAAAIDTTASFLNNTVYLLDRHRDQRRWLLENPDSLEPALEECLRFESPVQNAKRTVTKAVELNGSSMPQGATVAVLFGSANRDEHRYEEADRFDLQRPQQRTLAFGEGIHHCLGAPLARMEGRVAIGALLRVMPDYELAETPERFRSHVVRGFSRLVIAPAG